MDAAVSEAERLLLEEPPEDVVELVVPWLDADELDGLEPVAEFWLLTVEVALGGAEDDELVGGLA